MVEPEQMQEVCVIIVNMNGVTNDGGAVVIGFAIRHTAPHTRPGQQ